ncbi:Transcription initiation factor IID subunit [Trichostrongylus colubriformis]|uniref:Transcription initiation factor IID subunit n=1 Tax=Trichostrongylus colubriformis TaxID=6319 RepID=A0AAN8IUS2_TRICO
MRRSTDNDMLELTAYYREVVRRMMYCNGDLEDPLSPCVEMVLDMVKHQMVKVLEDAARHANIQKRELITLEDVLFLFRRHKFLLKRLLHFADAAERINELKRAAPQTAKLDEEPDLESGVDEDDVADIASTSVPDSNLGRMLKYVDSLGLEESAEELLTAPDRELERRQLRIADIVMNDLSAEEYPRFTAARSATFLDDVRRHSRRRDAGNLLRWLGAPKCEPSVSFVLAFIGREVVAYYVDAAYVVMTNEERNLFLNEVHDGHIAAEDEICPLQLRHYEEALRRCVGWRRHRDFLFGYYDESQDKASELNDGVEAPLISS